MPGTTKQTMTSLRKQVTDKMKNENILINKIKRLEDKIIELQAKPTMKKRFGGSLNKKNALKKAIQNVKNKTKSKTKKMNNKNKMV